MRRNPFRTALAGFGALVVRLVVLAVVLVGLLAVVAPAIAGAYTTWAQHLASQSSGHSSPPTTHAR